MNYGTLKTKLELIRSEGETNLSTISNLSSYFLLIHTHYSTQYNSLNEKFKDHHLSAIENPNSTPNLSSNISSLYSSFSQMAVKANKLLDKLSQDIISSLDRFHKNQSQINTTITSDFQSLIDKTIQAQRSLDNSKFIYYNSCFLVNQKPTAKSSQRLQLTKTNNEKLYQYEYDNYTKAITQINAEYDKLMADYKQNEESRIFFIKCVVDKYTKLISEYQDILAKLITIINELFSSKICEDELQGIVKKLQIDKMNANSNRISAERYIPFDEYSKITKEESNSPFNFEIVASSEENDENQLLETMSKLKEQLLSKEEADVNQISLLIKYLRNNPNRIGNLFLDSFLNEEWYQCLNQTNFNYFLTLFLFIDNSINQDKQEECKTKDITEAQYHFLLERYLTNIKIINVSQKVFYIQNNKSTEINKTISKVKTYLSALISKKDVMFHSKSFWKESFNMTVAVILMNHLSSSSIKQPQSQNEDNDIESSSQMSHLSRAKTLISYASTTVSSSILSRIWPTNDLRSKGVLFKTKISCLIPNYSKLSINDINVIEEMAIEAIKKDPLMKKFIGYMSCFNYPIEKIIELITEIGDEAKLSKDLLNYYLSICNVNRYTIKRYLPNDSACQAYYYYMNNYRLTSKDRRIQLITFGLEYLEWKDFFVLLQLNKAAYKKLSNKIFKKALQRKHLSIDTRLMIWHSILKVNRLKKNYSYSALISKASLQLDEKTKQSIEVDIPRTYIPLSLEKDKARTSIRNILLAISQVNGDGKYCQGMNYIAQFLYEITKDEEKAFNIFLGIFKSTEYSLIFGQDLLKFKVFFYVFQRLLSLYEPEINALFEQSKCDVYYFLAPCFYTLFQNARESIQDEGIPIILLRILDGFVISGWKGLMKVGLNLLNYASSDIIKMSKEELYEFITTKIFSIDFFGNEKIDQFELLQQKKIPKKLIEYIEQEYIQEIALKETEKKLEKEKENVSESKKE